MTTTDIVGDVVQVLLKEPGELAYLGFEKTSLFLQVVGIDEAGIWCAHPNYNLVKVNDEEGNPLPPEEQVHTQVEANFLIRWEQIATIVHFPDREGFDFPSPFEKHIGFVIPSDEMGVKSVEKKS
ncbi:MAG: hypothetical protein ACETWG_11750 [Candidatus Neomarinimicrobiota bacterium]